MKFSLSSYQEDFQSVLFLQSRTWGIQRGQKDAERRGGALRLSQKTAGH